MDIISLINTRRPETFDLNRTYVNHQLTRVLEVIGFNRTYVSGQGAWLTDDQGVNVLDFLAGFGVFNVGRGHPVVAKVMHDMIDANPPSMVQMGAGCVAGLLAEALAEIAPGNLSKVFFTTSGTESVEGALKFARQATKRARIVYCEKAFHGLTLGSLSVNGNEEFRSRNEPLLPECVSVPFNDLEALEKALSSRDVAAFIFEPVQGKTLRVAAPGYLAGVRALCDTYGTLMVADEVQTGFGRTGKMFAVDHDNVVPDIMAVSKALSGGFVPVGAVIATPEVYDKVFDCMDRCYAHSNTFGRGDLAMAAGLAVLHVLKTENLVAHAAEMGDYLLAGLNALVAKYEMLHEIRGRGLMLGLQFGEPKSLGLKTGWKLIHSMNPDLFCQMITMPLLEKHNVLTQVAGHHMDTVKILPPLTITKAEADFFLTALDSVLKSVHTFPGSAWSSVKNLAVRTAKTS